MAANPLGHVVRRGRAALAERGARLRTKGFAVAQCAVAAGMAWFIAADLLGHETPFFAPIAAVVSLGTSYGQRLRRVAEVTMGVAVGVLVADLFLVWIGSGWWQLTLIVGLAMTAAILLDGGQLLVTQAAVQSIVVTALVVEPDAALIRWTDALVGGAVALVAATAVPAAPLRRPREQAARVVAKLAGLLRATAAIVANGAVEPALDLLADARRTDYLIRELRDAADEGLAVVASSPFRLRHRGHVRAMADLVDPLDRALRSTRVLVRQTAVAAYHVRPVPASYAALCDALAAACEVMGDELARNRMPEAARPLLLAVAEASGEVERSPELAAEAMLAQLRSITVDLLMITGVGQFEATDLMPPPREPSTG